VVGTAPPVPRNVTRRDISALWPAPVYPFRAGRVGRLTGVCRSTSVCRPTGVCRPGRCRHPYPLPAWHLDATGRSRHVSAAPTEAMRDSIAGLVKQEGRGGGRPRPLRWRRGPIRHRVLRGCRGRRLLDGSRRIRVRHTGAPRGDSRSPQAADPRRPRGGRRRPRRRTPASVSGCRQL